MITFLKLWEHMQSQEDQPLKASGESSLAIQAVRAGMYMRGEDAHRTFWDDFVQLCDNANGLSELLEVAPEHVAKWGPRIKEMVDRIGRDEDRRGGEKNTVLPTGDSGVSHNPF